MPTRPKESVLRWRWTTVVMTATSIVGPEIKDGHLSSFTDIEGGFVLQILILAARFPITVGLTLGRSVFNIQGRTRMATNSMDSPDERTNGVRRVFVVENQSLLGAGITSLLARETDLQVDGMTPEDEVVLIGVIRLYRPDAVVLDESTTDATRLCRLLQDLPELRVVVVSANDDLAQVYDKHEVLITQASDLVDVIRQM